MLKLRVGQEGAVSPLVFNYGASLQRSKETGTGFKPDGPKGSRALELLSFRQFTFFWPAGELFSSILDGSGGIITYGSGCGNTRVLISIVSVLATMRSCDYYHDATVPLRLLPLRLPLRL